MEQFIHPINQQFLWKIIEKTSAIEILQGKERIIWFKNIIKNIYNNEKTIL